MFKNVICLTLIVCLNARLITSASILETLLANLGDFIQEQIDQRAAEDETYVLQYFDTKGRSEFIRWIFAYAGKQFVDNRVKAADWDQLKPTEPFLQLPILNVTRPNEKIEIAQSKAIARYLARRFDLNGRTMNDEVFADMYGEQLGDLFNAWKNATDNKHPETVYTDVYPQNLVFFEKRLIATGNGLLAGDEVTWADVYLSQMIDFIADKRDQVLKAFPHVKALDDRIRSHPNIKAYLKVRIDN